MLTKEQILSADDRAIEVVEVPEWGGTVRVTTMAGEERDAFEQETIVMRGKDVHQNLANLRARLCVRCIVDDDGNRLFDDADAVALGKKSASALDRVFGVAQRLNGLRDEDVETLAKN